MHDSRAFPSAAPAPAPARMPSIRPSVSNLEGRVGAMRPRVTECVDMMTASDDTPAVCSCAAVPLVVCRTTTWLTPRHRGAAVLVFQIVLAAKTMLNSNAATLRAARDRLRQVSLVVCACVCVL